MIDYFALALGHGLLALVFVRLFMWESVDGDPAIEKLKHEAEAKRPDPRGKRASSRRHQSGRSRNQARAKANRQVNESTIDETGLNEAGLNNENAQ